MRLTILAGPGDTTTLLRNYLADHGYNDVETILEEPVPRRQMLAYRRRRLGLVSAAGQLAFMAGILPLLRFASRGRRKEIVAAHGLRLDEPSDVAFRVATINDQAVVDRLTSRAPDAVIVNGARIIRRQVLDAVNCPVINTHVGITPEYRGVHGGVLGALAR